jgi:16S rRNA (guanine966-N2)-methyltransferase
MLRIVAGEWGGRRIRAPRGRDTRPTAEKVRAAVFNVLAARFGLEGAAVWDLFAGSGAMGIEALSRGARHATFVEADRRTAALIAQNLTALGAPRQQWSVAESRVKDWLRHAARPQEPLLVLIDPPYGAGEDARILGLLAELDCVPGGTVMVLEGTARAAAEPPPGLELIQAKRYGGTGVRFLVKRPAPPGQATPHDAENKHDP